MDFSKENEAKYRDALKAKGITGDLQDQSPAAESKQPVITLPAQDDFFEDELVPPADLVAKINGKEHPSPEPEVKQPPVQYDNFLESGTDEEKMKFFYDFTRFPQLTCKFLGSGRAVRFKAGVITTWLVEEKDGTQWLVPQWQVLAQPQGSFLGFPSEVPGKYIYQLTYKGLVTTENNGSQHQMAVLKKIPM